MKITESEFQERKSRIIHEAFQLFSRRGIDDVSIQEIARKSEVSEKSIYRYFKTKTNLLVETIEMLWKEIINELSVQIDEAYEQKSGLEQIQLLLEGFRNLFDNHANYVVFSYDYKLYLIRHGEFLTIDVYDDILHPLHELYINALEKGRRDGSIRAEGDSEDLYWAIWGMMRGYVVKIVIYDRMYTGKELWRKRFPIVCHLILSGLRNGFFTDMAIPLPPAVGGRIVQGDVLVC